MSWPERISKYQQEQASAEQERASAWQERQEIIYTKAVELTNELLQVLDNLECRELLTGIRNEIWGSGEVSIFSLLCKPVEDSPEELARKTTAVAQFQRKWRHLGEVEHRITWINNENQEESRKTGPEIQHAWIDEPVTITISASFDKESLKNPEKKKVVVIKFGNHSTFLDEDTHKWLENELVKYCMERKEYEDYFFNASSQRVPFLGIKEERKDLGRRQHEQILETQESPSLASFWHEWIKKLGLLNS